MVDINAIKHPDKRRDYDVFRARGHTFKRGYCIGFVDQVKGMYTFAIS